jgi:hypothetical protein
MDFGMAPTAQGRVLANRVEAGVALNGEYFVRIFPNL